MELFLITALNLCKMCVFEPLCVSLMTCILISFVL